MLDWLLLFSVGFYLHGVNLFLSFLLQCICVVRSKQVKKQQLELDMEQQTVQIGKGAHQGCILSPYLFNFYAEYIMRNAGLDKAQAGTPRLLGVISIISDMQMTPPLWQKVTKN